MFVLNGGRFTRALMVEMAIPEGGVPCELRAVDILRDGRRDSSPMEPAPSSEHPALCREEAPAETHMLRVTRGRGGGGSSTVECLRVYSPHAPSMVPEP